MKIRYVRVSTQAQNLNLQTDALKQANCEKIFEEKVRKAINLQNYQISIFYDLIW